MVAVSHIAGGRVFRARLILALADGRTYDAIKRELHTTARTIARWKQRFEESGIEGLEPKHQGSKPRTATARCKPGCAGRCSKNRGTGARIGRYVSWRPRWA